MTPWKLTLPPQPEQARRDDNRRTTAATLRIGRKQVATTMSQKLCRGAGASALWIWLGAERSAPTRRPFRPADFLYVSPLEDAFGTGLPHRMGEAQD